MKSTFVEICIYEVKPDKIDEFESLIEKVAKHRLEFPGVIDVRYMKRTHRQADFNAVKNGKPAIRLTRTPKSVTYVLYWELDNEINHGKATKSGLEKFYKEFTRCLVTMPKIILGERIQ
ncbi:conserved hypothetical protein [groundwater metagenome]|uniref:ABM domain-containing protein n=1 Tax=groundwater metagenome TaxID=717931 RepID=A0A098ECQ7_9ZZZZ